MPDETWRVVTTPDGRSLEVLVVGSPDGRPLVFHGGTPVAAVPFPPLIDAAAHRDLQVITYSRPGYATSDPQPGRSVADAAADVAAILDVLGHEHFVTVGWSGGGPHALACGALLPERCLGVATIAGVASYPADGLDWLAGQGEENIDEFSTAIQGEAALTAWLNDAAEDMAHVMADDVVAVLGDLVSDVDKASLTGDFAEWCAGSFRKAVSTGIAGWRDDDLAFLKPWGFALDDITRPVAVWQGGQDRMVPFAHGEWLAGHIGAARSHLLPDEGHLSISVGRLPEIITELIEVADLAEPV